MKQGLGRLVELLLSTISYFHMMHTMNIWWGGSVQLCVSSLKLSNGFWWTWTVDRQKFCFLSVQNIDTVKIYNIILTDIGKHYFWISAKWCLTIQCGSTYKVHQAFNCSICSFMYIVCLAVRSLPLVSR
jgi:hypothetical protein